MSLFLLARCDDDDDDDDTTGRERERERERESSLRRFQRREIINAPFFCPFFLSLFFSVSRALVVFRVSKSAFSNPK